MKITIATHCWAVKHPLYAVFLRAQLTSIAINYPQCPIKVVVAVDLDDTRTIQVINDFLRMQYAFIKPLILTTPRMWRRCIGRNIIAKDQQDSDLVWFTDCDYMFGPGCIDEVLKCWSESGCPDLIWPLSYSANEDKLIIDEFWEKNLETRGLLIAPTCDPFAFPCRRAIGGVQIVSGSWARREGYLDGHHKWQAPPSIPFPDTRDDLVFREKLLKVGTSASIPSLPSLFRLRHTEVGYGPKSRSDHEVQDIPK